MNAPQLYTYADAAAALRVEESWLRRHIKGLPHSKLGRRVLFTVADLERIATQHHHEPVSGPTARVNPHPLASLRPLPARRTSRP